MKFTSNYMISMGNYRLIGPSKILNFQIVLASSGNFVSFIVGERPKFGEGGVDV